MYVVLFLLISFLRGVLLLIKNHKFDVSSYKEQKVFIVIVYSAKNNDIRKLSLHTGAPPSC